MKQMLGVVLAVSAIVTAGYAVAQANYPEKPIRIIVGFPAGSSPDITARHLGQKLAESWAKSVVKPPSLATAVVMLSFWVSSLGV